MRDTSGPRDGESKGAEMPSRRPQTAKGGGGGEWAVSGWRRKRVKR